MKEFKNGKAPGPEGLTPIMLKHLPENTLERVQWLMRACLATGHTPLTWRKGQLKFLMKPGKRDLTDPRAYRPITLACFMLKALERIVSWELEENYFRKKPLNKRQHAFQLGKSCDTALSEAIDYIEKGIERKQYVLGVFLDIKGAFDNVDPDKAIEAMEERGVDKYITRWYGNFIKSRTITAEFLGAELRRWIRNGCPQGGILSTTFWNIIFDFLLEILNEDPLISFAYADDNSIYATGSHLPDLRKRVQKALEKAEAWGSRFGLQFCTKKTVAVIFHKTQTKHNMKPLQLYGQDIKTVTSVRYLGVILDQKLTFQEHIKEKIKTCHSSLTIINQKLRASHGPVARLAKWIYTGVILPKLTYGCHIWQHKLTKTNILKLQGLQRRGAKTICSYFPGTSTKTLEGVLDLMPLEHKLKEIALCTRARIDVEPKWDGLSHKGKQTSHLHLLEKELYNMDIFDRDNYVTRNMPTLDITTKKDTDPAADIQIYTDASKNKLGVGCGIHINGTLEKEIKMKINNECEVLQAEVIAIQEAGRIIEEKNIENTTITLYSDSQAALQKLSKTKITDRETREALEIWKRIATKNKAKLRWVKAHSKCLGNERADSLAKEATRIQSMGFLTDPPIRSIYRKIRINMRHTWESEWAQNKNEIKPSKNWLPKKQVKNKNEIKQTKQCLPMIDQKKSNALLKLSRFTISRAIQAISGFNNLQLHTARKSHSLNLNKKCRMCNRDEETGWHLAKECSSKKVKEAQIPGDDWTAKDIIHFVHHPVVDKLMSERYDEAG